MIDTITLHKLLAFAATHGLHVTSTTGGHHNPGSLHYIGHAIDVRSRGLSELHIKELEREAMLEGIHVRDERTHPVGQAVWGGPHLHLEIPV